MQRLFHFPLFPTASRVDLPQDPSTEREPPPSCPARTAHKRGTLSHFEASRLRLLLEKVRRRPCGREVGSGFRGRAESARALTCPTTSRRRARATARQRACGRAVRGGACAFSLSVAAAAVCRPLLSSLAAALHRYREFKRAPRAAAGRILAAAAGGRAARPP